MSVRRTCLRVLRGACVPLALASAPLCAGSVQVTSGAAHTGGEGLRIAVTNTGCNDQNRRRISNQSLSMSSTQGACETLAADHATVQSPAAVTFLAGYRVSLGAGFGVERGANFAVSLDPGRVRGGFVRDDSPAAEPHYAVSFYVNADGLTLGGSEQLLILEAVGPLGRDWFTLNMQFDSASSQKTLYAEAASGGATATSGAFTVNPGWQRVELEWRAADSGAANGSLSVTRDGASQPGLSGLDNANGRIESVRWGVLNALPVTGGQLDLDEFVSRRAGPIGP